MLVQCAYVFWGRVRRLEALIRLCVHIVRLCIIYACVCVWLCTHGVLYYRPQHPIFFPSPLLSSETPALFLHQAYLARPFILARSSVRQKETSAQWENALIIHDHLTIQDLVCAAYVAFLISARQPHLLMAVSLLLFWILYLQITTTQNAIIIIIISCLCNSRKNIFCLLKGDEHNTRMRTIVFSLPLFVACGFSCNLLQFGCLFSNICDIRHIIVQHSFFLRCVQEVLSKGDLKPTQIHLQMHKLHSAICGVFFLFLFIWLDFSLSLSALLLSPSLTPHPFVPITTKPCHHGSCGHVNQPGQHHLFPAVYLQPNKGVCLFVVAGVECCVGWGLLFNSTCCYQPPPPLSEKANSTQRINGREETRREDVNVGVVGHLETISNPSSQRSQDRLGTKEEDHRQTWKANK